MDESGLLITDETPATSSRYESRKFLLALLTILLAVGLSVFDKLTPALVGMLTWVLGLYFSANVGQKAAEWFAAFAKSK